jgi:hypothetical protein
MRTLLLASTFLFSVIVGVAKAEEVYLICKGSHPDGANIEFPVYINEKKKTIIAKNRKYEVKKLIKNHLTGEENKDVWRGKSLLQGTTTDEIIYLDRITGNGEIYYAKNKDDNKPVVNNKRYFFSCNKVQKKF